jgi:hypothetical protein
MAGEKFGMPSGSRTLLARRLLLVTRQEVQCATIVESAELHQGAPRITSSETEVIKFDMVWAKCVMP